MPLWLAKVFAWAGGYWLIFTIYSFMGAVVYGLAWLLCAAAGFDWQAVGPRLSAYIRACILMILVVARTGLSCRYTAIFPSKPTKWKPTRRSLSCQTPISAPC